MCPRHPDRVAVRFQRRPPACPQCQVPSAVGVHCVDCARKSTASRRDVRSWADGRWPAPWSPRGLIIACVTIYLAQMAAPAGRPAAFVPAAGEHPAVALRDDRFPRFAHAPGFQHGPCGCSAAPWNRCWAVALRRPVRAERRGQIDHDLLAGTTGVVVWWGVDGGASGAVFGYSRRCSSFSGASARTTAIIKAAVLNHSHLFPGGEHLLLGGHLGDLTTGALAALSRGAPRAEAHRPRGGGERSSPSAESGLILSLRAGLA